MKQRNMNFRQTRSERSGDSSYSNFRKGLAQRFKMKNLKEKFK